MLVANLRDNVKLMMKKIREKVWPHVVFYAALHGLSYNHHDFFAEARYVYQNDTSASYHAYSISKTQVLENLLKRVEVMLCCVLT